MVAGAGVLIPLTSRGPGLAWFVAGQVLMTAGTSIRLFSRGALPLGAITGGTLATLLAARPTIAILMALMLVVPVLLHRSPLGRVRRVADLAP